ncbi:MAG: DUF5715 family protein [bacterium]|nr:DUF5715 family protein [bacterium]
MLKLITGILFLTLIAYGANPLAGNRRRLIDSNERADALNISQISDENISYFKRHDLVVKIPDKTASFYLDPGHVLKQFRYARPWTVAYLIELASEYYAQFNKPLRVTSALRTVQHQRRLMRRNRNASPAKGSWASLHVRGISIDISHKNMSRKQKSWMRKRLTSDMQTGLIDAIEETRGSACFHIVVFPEDRLPE